MNKPLQLRLHAPVPKLHAAQLIRAHQRHILLRRLLPALHRRPMLRQPPVRQRSASRLLRHKALGILFGHILGSVRLVTHHIDQIHHPVAQILSAQLEHVLLVAIVIEVVRLDLQRELLDERARVARLRVRVRIPGLLLDGEGALRQQALDPAGQVAAHVVDLARVLAGAAGSAVVRLVGEDLDAAAGAAGLLAALFLRVEMDKR